MSVSVGHGAGVVHDPYSERIGSYRLGEGGGEAACVPLFLELGDLCFGDGGERAELSRGGELKLLLVLGRVGVGC